ncbi:MAG: Uma2 family endonuclease [Bacteroidota bacterium]
MNTANKRNKTYSYNEYLELEKETNEKHDFFFGEVFNLAGGTIKHNLIVNNISYTLKGRLKNKRCLILTENVKFEIKKDDFYVYPDIMLTCDEEDLKNNKDTLIKHPIIIIEILSESTELYDRNTKKKFYLEHPSLKYYLLVSQETQRVEMYEKNNSHIEYSYYEKSEEIINFRQLDFNMSVSDIYGTESL